jgi:hypothetical protein
MKLKFGYRVLQFVLSSCAGLIFGVTLAMAANRISPLRAIAEIDPLITPSHTVLASRVITIDVPVKAKNTIVKRER